MACFALVFAIGFMLGALRVLLIVPSLGERLAVLLELPILLAISWLACGAIAHLFAVPSTLAARLAMGALAFALLTGAELGVSVVVFERTLAGHVASFGTEPAASGLIGQVAFALFPMLQRTSKRASALRRGC